MLTSGPFTGSGEDWQQYCMMLLAIRYPVGELVTIPDRDRGDLGIEAYSRDGCTYQCYAAEEPLSTEARYIKQRDKMSRDLKKVIDNCSRFEAILGPLQLRRWIFMVPIHDSKQLVEHAETKADEIRRAGVSYIAVEFAITIVTAESFPIEVQSLTQSTLGRMSITVAMPSEQEVDEFSSAHTDLVLTMEQKLSKLASLREQNAMRRAKAALLKAYLLDLAVEAELRDQLPILYESVGRVIADTEYRLEVLYGPLTAPSDAPVEKVARELSEALRGKLPGFEVHTADDVAYGRTADWLMRCPLEFS